MEDVHEEFVVHGMEEAFLLHALDAFAASGNRFEEYVEQWVRHAVIPDSVRLDHEPDEIVALSAEGIGDQERWFDDRDGLAPAPAGRGFGRRFA
jgi:hypothetical protein